MLKRVRTLNELAAALGVHRQTIHRRQKSPGCPPKIGDDEFDVAAWRKFMGPVRPDHSGETREDAETRKIKLQNEKLQFQIGVMRRDYVPAVEVEKWGAELGAEIRKAVTTLHRCAFSLVGRTVEDIEERLQEQEQQVLKRLHTLDRSMKQYADSAAAPIETDDPAA